MGASQAASLRETLQPPLPRCSAPDRLRFRKARADAAGPGGTNTTAVCWASMGRYFFHTECDIRYSDVEGVELRDTEAARVHAATFAGEILQDGARMFWGSKPWTMTVTNAEGLIYFTLLLHGQDAAAASLRGGRLTARP